LGRLTRVSPRRNGDTNFFVNLPAMVTGNRAVFENKKVVQEFIGREGWLDHGELAALLSVAPVVRSEPVLDIGVGLGRSSSLLRMVTDAYVAVDYSTEMVRQFRELHPEVAVSVGDARDLSSFQNGSFALVYFSDNGVDAIDEKGRKQYLSEAHRVLRDDGLLIHSTLNKEGQNYGETPWQLHHPGQSPNLAAKRIAQWCWHNLKDPLRAPRRYRNWFVSKRSASDNGDWAMFPFSAHDFAIVAHFVTISRVRAELDEAGFDVLAVHDSRSGALIEETVSHSDTPMFYAVARRRS
jgi:SAM-dependent methyltransferase